MVDAQSISRNILKATSVAVGSLGVPVGMLVLGTGVGTHSGDDTPICPARGTVYVPASFGIDSKLSLSAFNNRHPVRHTLARQLDFSNVSSTKLRDAI